MLCLQWYFGNVFWQDVDVDCIVLVFEVVLIGSELCRKVSNSISSFWFISVVCGLLLLCSLAHIPICLYQKITKVIIIMMIIRMNIPPKVPPTGSTYLLFSPDDEETI